MFRYGAWLGSNSEVMVAGAMGVHHNADAVLCGELDEVLALVADNDGDGCGACFVQLPDLTLDQDLAVSNVQTPTVGQRVLQAAG